MATPFRSAWVAHVERTETDRCFLSSLSLHSSWAPSNAVRTRISNHEPPNLWTKAPNQPISGTKLIGFWKGDHHGSKLGLPVALDSKLPIGTIP